MSEEINGQAAANPADNVVNEPVEFSKTEQTAIEQGWVPKEEFLKKENAEEHKWVDAGEFLRRGELFGKIDQQNRELKETRRTLEALQQHYLKVQETEYKRAVDTLKKQKKDALIENDVEAVLEVDEQLDTLREEQLQQAARSAQRQMQEQANQPHPEFVSWTQKNSWYETNKPMRAFADALGSDLQGQGKTPSEVLRIVAEEVRKEFSSKFYNPKRDEPSGVEGTGSQKSGGKSDKVVLTDFEASIMKKLVGQGVLTKEQYIADIKAQRERS